MNHYKTNKNLIITTFYIFIIIHYNRRKVQRTEWQKSNIRYKERGQTLSPSLFYSPLYLYDIKKEGRPLLYYYFFWSFQSFSALDFFHSLHYLKAPLLFSLLSHNHFFYLLFLNVFLSYLEKLVDMDNIFTYFNCIHFLFVFCRIYTEFVFLMLHGRRLYGVWWLQGDGLFEYHRTTCEIVSKSVEALSIFTDMLNLQCTVVLYVLTAL